MQLYAFGVRHANLSTFDAHNARREIFDLSQTPSATVAVISIGVGHVIIYILNVPRNDTFK